MTSDHGWAVPHFKDRAVLVSGGTSGIGLAIANAFAAAGAKVTATGIADAAFTAARSAAENGVEFIENDVRDADAIKTLVAGLSRLDVLINCAGMIRQAEEFQPETFAEVLAVNLTGTMRFCEACRPLLGANGGAIVNTASMFSYAASGLAPGYSASKGGVAQLTKSLAIAYAAEGIRVNAVAPGWIETPLSAGARTNPERNAAILSRTPMKRWGTPDDLTGPVLFLCSPLAGFITGTILPVDGGYLAV